MTKSKNQMIISSLTFIVYDFLACLPNIVPIETFKGETETLCEELSL